MLDKINILTRTHNRPNYFNNCLQSINSQTYKNINHIISIDDDKSLDYINGLNYIKVIPEKENDLIKSTYNKNSCGKFCPYEQYLNIMLNHVNDGWVIILDDDDKFKSNNSLQNLINHIKTEDDLLLWKVDFNNRIIPNKCFGKYPLLNDISMIGFMFHSKWKQYVDFGYYTGGDFRVIKTLYDIIPNKIWIDSIETGLQDISNNGKSEFN